MAETCKRDRKCTFCILCVCVGFVLNKTHVAYETAICRNSQR